jgi:hypothetical protein
MSPRHEAARPGVEPGTGQKSTPYQSGSTRPTVRGGTHAGDAGRQDESPGQPIDRSGLGSAIEHADPWWLECALQAIEDLAATGREFTAWDLSDMGVPDPDRPARWGAAFSVASTRGLIEAVGYQVSRRPSRGGGACRVWRGVESVQLGGEAA